MLCFLFQPNFIIQKTIPSLITIFFLNYIPYYLSVFGKSIFYLHERTSTHKQTSGLVLPLSAALALYLSPSPTPTPTHPRSRSCSCSHAPPHSPTSQFVKVTTDDISNMLSHVMMFLNFVSICQESY